MESYGLHWGLGFSDNLRYGVLEDDSEADDLDVGKIVALSLDLDIPQPSSTTNPLHLYSPLPH